MLAYDCFWSNARVKRQDPNTFVPHHWLLTVSSHQAPRLLMDRGHSSWGMSLLCSPLRRLRIKATFLLPPNSVSTFFTWLQLAEKAKILASINFSPFLLLCIQPVSKSHPFFYTVSSKFFLTFSAAETRLMRSEPCEDLREELLEHQV